MAAAVMALMNPLLGLEPVSWNIFLAGMVGMAMDLDFGQSRVAVGSPLGHSLGSGMVITYLAGLVAYFGHAFAGWDLFTGMTAVLAIGVGIFIHLAAEYLTGQQIFTVPRDLDMIGWFRRIDDGSERFWNGWSRAGLRNGGLKNYQVNGMAVVLILVAIGIF
jgi:hypothetical protein